MLTNRVALLVVCALFVGSNALTCPGTTIVTNDITVCPCISQAVLSLTADTLTFSVAGRPLFMRIDGTATMTMIPSYKVPESGTAPCRGRDFTSVLPENAYSWTIVDDVYSNPIHQEQTNSATWTVNGAANGMDAWGRYYLAATISDPAMGRKATARSATFKSSNAQTKLAVTTTSMATGPYNIKIQTEVLSSSTQFTSTWNCITHAGNPCPLVLVDALDANGTTYDGAFLSGPIPSGVYNISMTYNAVTTDIISLQVRCDAENLRADGTCPGACTYTCPDGTCAGNFKDCACVQAAVLQKPVLSATFDSTDAFSTAITLDSSAVYRQINGSCSSYDFNDHTSVAWRVYLQYTDTPLVLETSMTKSRLVIANGVLTEGQTYTFTAIYTNIFGGLVSTSYTHTVPTFTPFVSVTQKGSTVVVGPTNIFVNAVVTYKHADGTIGTWGCTIGGAQCPSILRTALSANRSNTGLTIGGPVPAGTYIIWMEYKGVTSERLTMIVKSTDVPQVSILAADAIKQSPVTFVAAQTVTLRASVKFVNKTVLTWFVNGVSYGSSDVLALPGTSLLATNVIKLRANSTYDVTVFGETTLNVDVVTSPTVSLTVTNRDHPSSALTALFDSASLQYTVADLSSVATIKFEAGYIVGGVKMLTVHTGATSAVFVTPMLETGTTVLTFYVDAIFGGVLVSTSTRNHTVSLPEPCAAQEKQLELASSADATVKRTALLNLGYLAKACPTTASRNAVLNNLATLESGTDAQGPVLDSLNKVLDSLITDGEPVTTTDVVTKATNYLLEVASRIGKNDAAAFVLAAGKLNATVKLSEALEKMTKSVVASAEFGEKVTFKTADAETVMVATKMTGASAQSVALSSTSSSISGNLAAAGIAADAVVTVTSTVSSNNVYGKSNGQNATSAIVSYSVAVNGADYDVSGLSQPLYITIASDAGPGAVCQYYDTTTETWSTTNTWLYSYTDVSVTCATTHLTTFTTFGSSAATVVASLFAVVVAVVMQMLA